MGYFGLGWGLKDLGFKVQGTGLLEGSWDLVSMVISTLIGVICNYKYSYLSNKPILQVPGFRTVSWSFRVFQTLEPQTRNLERATGPGSLLNLNPSPLNP